MKTITIIIALFEVLWCTWFFSCMISNLAPLSGKGLLAPFSGQGNSGSERLSESLPLSHRKGTRSTCLTPSQGELLIVWWTPNCRDSPSSPLPAVCVLDIKSALIREEWLVFADQGALICWASLHMNSRVARHDGGACHHLPRVGAACCCPWHQHLATSTVWRAPKLKVQESKSDAILDLIELATPVKQTVYRFFESLNSVKY